MIKGMTNITSLSFLFLSLQNIQFEWYHFNVFTTNCHSLLGWLFFVMNEWTQITVSGTVLLPSATTVTFGWYNVRKLEQKISPVHHYEPCRCSTWPLQLLLRWLPKADELSAYTNYTLKHTHTQTQTHACTGTHSVCSTCIITLILVTW